MRPSSQKGRQWWAFQAVKVLPQPVSAHASTARTKLDHFVLREAGRERADAVAAGRRSHADSPRVHRSHRPEADLRRSRGVRQRRVAGQIREARRHAAGACRSTASDGDAIGSTSCATAKTIPATSRTRRIRTRGGIATGSSRRSTRMCPYDRFVKLQLAADLMPGTSRPDMRALGPDRARPAGSQRRAALDRRHRHASTERLGRAARHRDARAARIVGVVRALPRSQVRSDPADGLRAADERVRVDVARAASVLRDRSEDRNALHVGVSADVRPALHGEPARKRSRDRSPSRPSGR